MTDDNAAESREGLLDHVKGKAKEVAGAVSGNDELVEEGQIQQAEADRRKAAIADEAVADVKRSEAVQDLQQTDREVADQQHAAGRRADREVSDAERERQDAHLAAARDAAATEARGHDAAEQRAEQVAESRLTEAETLESAAESTEQKAAAERQRLEREAAVADQHAAELRARTEK
ncbi:hypothetical protein [Aeromicrobium marinum]|uniref:hypothetical protein n=1 Tax=Aeromicrobium marinum TaxID=219314 RepID=UPI0005917351|nr:hypothetical protein [Aeromicrobium marinum]